MKPSSSQHKKPAKAALASVSAAASVTREITDMLQITPVKAVASILLMIFETVEVG